MMRRFCLLLALSLAGCQTFFLPPYSQDIHDEIAQASDGLQRIQVLLADTDHRTLADVEPTYVDILTHLGQAHALAEDRAQKSSGPERQSAQIISDNVGRCEDAVRSALKDTRDHGPLDIEDFKARLISETCNFPKIEEEMLQR